MCYTVVVDKYTNFSNLLFSVNISRVIYFLDHRASERKLVYYMVDTCLEAKTGK